MRLRCRRESRRPADEASHKNSRLGNALVSVRNHCVRSGWDAGASDKGADESLRPDDRSDLVRTLSGVSPRAATKGQARLEPQGDGVSRWGKRTGDCCRRSRQEPDVGDDRSGQHAAQAPFAPSRQEGHSRLDHARSAVGQRPHRSVSVYVQPSRRLRLVVTPTTCETVGARRRRRSMVPQRYRSLYPRQIAH